MIFFTLYISLHFSFASGMPNGSCTSWKHADASCRKRGLQLPAILKKSDYQEVGKSMDIKGINTTWLGVKRRIYEDFRWIDCSKPSNRIMKRQNIETFHCGYLNTSAKQIERGQCSTGRGVLCSVPGCRGCEAPRCMNIRGRCYAVLCMTFSWEAAKVHCTTFRGHLAVIPAEHDQAIVQELSTKWPTSYCHEAWLGLSRQEWIFADVSSAQRVGYWAIGEPSEKGNCAVMENMGPSKLWKAVSCGHREHYTCQKVFRIRPTRWTKGNWNSTSNAPIFGTIHMKSTSSAFQEVKGIEYQNTITVTTLAATVVCTSSVLILILLSLFVFHKWNEKMMQFHSYPSNREPSQPSIPTHEANNSHPHGHSNSSSSRENNAEHTSETDAHDTTEATTLMERDRHQEIGGPSGEENV